MRGRVPGTGFPHVLGVCGEAPHLHEHDWHCVGLHNAGDRPCRTSSGSSSRTRQGKGGRDCSRRSLMVESLFRLSHSPRDIGDVVPTRSVNRASKASFSNRAWDLESVGRSSHCTTLGKCLSPLGTLVSSFCLGGL